MLGYIRARSGAPIGLQLFVAIAIAIILLQISFSSAISESVTDSLASAASRLSDTIKKPAQEAAIARPRGIQLSSQRRSRDPQWVKQLKGVLAQEKTPIVGMIFYGRYQTISILNTYLERNLVKNGGLLDHIVFLPRTDNKEDLAYLDRLIERNDPYYRQQAIGGKFWASHYANLDNSTIYVKIDDDVVFMSEYAIEMLVLDLLQTPSLVVSANVVNHPLLTSVHSRLGAMKPYKLKVDESSGPLDFKAGTGRVIAQRIRPDPLINTWPYKAPLLPIQSTNQSENPGVDGLDGTPAHKAGYGAFDSCTWHGWECAAIAHLSLQENAASGDLDVYDFGTWDFHSQGCDRWSVNFFAFFGHTINAYLLDELTRRDDEMAISSSLCKITGTHARAVGAALVAHYAYSPQTKGLVLTTEVLAGYRALARATLGYIFE